MTSKANIIVHVGAPKCGSSTLQAALSATPKQVSSSRGNLSYYTLSSPDVGWKPVTGRKLRLMKGMTPNGYVSCPNFSRQLDHKTLAGGLDQIFKLAKPKQTPVISQEGWYARAGDFARLLPHWFMPSEATPKVEVVALARPPLDWLNSAYWQWGIWSHGTFETWLEKSLIDFKFGQAFRAWADLPNVTLHLHLSGDVIDAFNQDFDVDLVRADTDNQSQCPAMVGFMMRNRRFRPSAHESSVEFIFQRWCTVPNAPKPWIIRPRDVPVIQKMLGDDPQHLLALGQEGSQDLADMFTLGAGGMARYYDRFAAGPSYLSDVEELADVYRALVRGVDDVARAANRAVPRLDVPPAVSAGQEVWDEVIAKALDVLIELDGVARKGWLRLLRG